MLSKSFNSYTSRFYLKCFKKRFLITRYSTQVNYSEDKLVKQEIKNEGKEEISKNIKSKANSPILKNIFCGRLDTNSLIFPEALTKSELKSLTETLIPIEEALQECEKSKGTLNDYLSNLKKFGLYGQTVEQQYGGENWKSTELLRLAELTASYESVSNILYNHNSLGIKCIGLYGTDEQKNKYLPKLTSGEEHIAMCINELNSGSDLSMVESTCELSKDGSHYILNGTKTWVNSAQEADVFIVFAKTNINLRQDKVEEKVTAFIVDKADGVTVGKAYKTVGLKEIFTSDVTFENVKVPLDNVLGEVGTGFQIAIQILHGDLHMKGATYASILKHLSESIVSHCIKRKQFGKPLKDFPMIQEKVANIVLDTYAMESMSYMTAGIIDQHHLPDAICEAVAVKVFSSEKLWSSLMDMQQILASSSCTYDGGSGGSGSGGSVGSGCGSGGSGDGGEDSNQYNSIAKHIDDARMNTISNSTSELLRLYIALNGLQYAGMQMQEAVRKMRSPLYNMGFILQQSFDQMKTNRKNPVLTLKLYQHVHPLLSICAETLEIRILKLKHLVAKYWTSYFNDLQHHQLALKKFADISIHMFAIICCLARASRSKAIGLQHADHEIEITQSILLKYMKKIDDDMEDLELGEHANGDEILTKIADHTFKNGRYPPVHPLTRNW